jgi:hypothetical protein
MKRSITVPNDGSRALSLGAFTLWRELLAWAGDGVNFRMEDGFQHARAALDIGRGRFRNAAIELEQAGFLTVDRDASRSRGRLGVPPGTAVHAVPADLTFPEIDPAKMRNSFRRPVGAHSAVYRLFNAEGLLLYVGCTNSMPQRWRGHSRTQPWWHEVESWTNHWFTTRAVAKSEESRAIARENPKYNIIGRERDV